MASEYFTYLARNEKPEDPPPPRTRKQKIKNWFYYNWYWLVIGAIILSVTGSMLWNALGIGKIKPDYIFAYIGDEPIPEEQANLFQTRIAEFGIDANGDRRVTVELRQYATGREGDMLTSLYYNYAADTLLLADITAGDSYFFLAKDPESVQRSYQIFAERGGSMPDENDYSSEGKVIAWNDSPILRSLDLDDSIFGKLSIGRRYFVDEKANKHLADPAFWDLLTEGTEL